MIIPSDMGDNAPKSPVIVRSDTFVTLLGGADLRATDLKWALSHAPLLVAADGGADTALAMGQLPEAVIGDLDSLSQDAKARLKSDKIHHIPEQLSTDFDKALRSIEAPGVLALGFVGGRADHALAALDTLLHPGRPPCILVGEDDVIFHAPRNLELRLSPGARVSLFPMQSLRGQSIGLDWPIDGLDFAPGLRIGTSNRSATGHVQLSFSGPGMLVILARDEAQAAIDAVFPQLSAVADGLE